MMLMECCSGHSTNWQSFIEAMPCLIKWILVVVVLIFLMKYLTRLFELWTKNCHEKKMEEKSFENEQWWHFQNDLKTDFEGALDKRTEELTKRIKQLKEELDKEKASREDKLEREKLQFEHDYYKKLLDDFYGKRDENK